MESTLISFVHQLGTLEFWQTLLDSFGDLGPLAPIFLAMVESFFPPLPLIAIVALNVAAHGGLFGFVYSWVGVMLGGTLMFLFWRRVLKQFFWKFASRSQKLEKAERWVSRCCRCCRSPLRPSCTLPSASRILTKNATSSLCCWARV